MPWYGECVLGSALLCLVAEHTVLMMIMWLCLSTINVKTHIWKLRDVNNYKGINLRVLDPLIKEFSGFCPARCSYDNYDFKLV